MADAPDRQAELARLWRERPRDAFVRWSLGGFLLAIVAAWAFGGFSVSDLLDERRLENLERFSTEITPYPARGSATPVSDTWTWAVDLLRREGWRATLQTLAISVASIAFASAAAFVLMWPAARTLASPEPYLPCARPPSRASRWLWGGVVGLTRFALIFLRSIPEYVWAFLFLAMLGNNAWPAILALAIHNAGILGKLYAEVVEDAETAAAPALRAIGARRADIAAVALFPTIFGRLMLFFFYRWESCVRTATVLGMLGIASLGYHIGEYRVRDRYDDMLFFIGLGVVLVLIGDALSAVCRAWLRRAS